MNKDNYIRLLESENLDLYDFNKELNEMHNDTLGIIDNIKKYAENIIENYNDTISDYMDDGYEENKDFIGQLREDKEHWLDILKICNRELDILYRKDYLN